MNKDRKQILHLASDEKFIDAGNYIFEKAFPGCNHFIIPYSRFRSKLEYVNINNKENYELLPFGKSLIKNMLERTLQYDCVFLHGITEINSNVFLLSQEKEKFVGIFWGAELYTEENFPEKNLLGEYTASMVIPEARKSFNEKLISLVRSIVYNKSSKIQNFSKLAASKLLYFSVPYIEEFNLFKEKGILSENCNHIPFTYYPIEYIMKGNEMSEINGNDILLGNSASKTNNHLEAFKILESMSIGNRRIIAPLSYGNKIYADYIQCKGYQLFKENFLPLRKFIPIEEYTREIQRCGIVIMNHYRQQGIGNIFAMLWLGSKIYLTQSNSCFHYLKRIGIIVFSIENDLNPENQDALKNLKAEEIQNNRNILKCYIGENQVINALKQNLNDRFPLGLSKYKDDSLN